jgi:hypothetical protein
MTFVRSGPPILYEKSIWWRMRDSNPGLHHYKKTTNQLLRWLKTRIMVSKANPFQANPTVKRHVSDTSPTLQHVKWMLAPTNKPQINDTRGGLYV